MSQFIEMFGGLCQDTPWSDVVTITNGKAYPEEYQEEGAYPICGSGGIMCYGEKKLCNGNTTILGSDLSILYRIEYRITVCQLLREKGTGVY